jgi:DNA adenine methylase
MNLTQPLKWHGGKSYLAKTIISLMPEHLHYVEPFFGGGAVLLNKDPTAVSEVANDINGELMNFWQVLRVDLDEMVERLALTPFSEAEWADAATPTTDRVEAACRFFIRCRQSRAGKFDSFATVTRNRTRRGMNEQVSAWLGAVEGLPSVANRMMRVLILSSPAVKVIKQQDGPNTLFYLDPPYVHESRVSTDDYEHEMTNDQHAELLETAKQCKGHVMISGYHNAVYDDMLKDWSVKEIEIDNKSSSAKVKPRKTEVLWCNFVVRELLEG